MQVGGEAIYGTRPIAPYKSKNICFTQKGNAVYAIYLAGEDEKIMPARITTAVPVKPKSIELLGSDKPLRWAIEGERVRIDVPESVCKQPPCQHAWVFKILFEE